MRTSEALTSERGVFSITPGARNGRARREARCAGAGKRGGSLRCVRAARALNVAVSW